MNKSIKNINMFKFYLDRRMIKILLLGLMSGFPWVIIGSSLSLWLKEEGLSRSTIGWAGLIFSVYAFNCFWAPLIDKLEIPFLTKRIGRRKAWIVLMQIIILISLLAWSLFDPNQELNLVIGVGLIIASASATQDIAIDALRIEQIGKNEKNAMAAGAAMSVIGWFTGYKLGGVIALTTAQYFENIGIQNYWQITFLVLCMCIIVCNIGLIFINEINFSGVKKDITKKIKNDNLVVKILSNIHSTFLLPLVSFFKKNSLNIAIYILGFIFLFKIGEAFLGRMSVVFYKEIGFSKSDIALYSKTFGWITTVLFTLLGGLFTIRSGIVKSLFVAGILMASTNLLFSGLAMSEKSYPFFALAVILDDVTAAFATVAFVTFISLLVDRNYTATQYAALASIGNLGRTTLGSSSGAVVDWLNGDWSIFFVITCLMVIPSLVLLYFIRNKIKINE